MNCIEVQEQLLLYVLGDDDASNHQQVKEHLSRCVECTKKESETRKLVERLDSSFKQRTNRLAQQFHERLAAAQPHQKEAYKEASSVKRPTLVTTRRIIAVAASLLIAIVGLYFWIGRGGDHFEFYFPNDGGFVKASEGSVVHQLAQSSFKLERGRLYLKLNKNFTEAQELTIQTEEGVIRILEADPDGTVDVEVIIEADKKSVIKVRSGVLEVTNRADPSKKTRASVGDTVSLSKEDMVIKSIKLLKEDRSFKDLYKRHPELVEALDEKEKIEWATLVGRKLKEKPKLLSPEEKKALAEVLLKNEKVVEKLKISRGEKVAREEAWLYMEALHQNSIFFYAARTLGELAGKFEIEISERALKVLLDKLEDEYVVTRELAAWALGQVARHLEPRLVPAVVGALLGMLKDIETQVRIATAVALSTYAQHLEGELLDKALSDIEAAIQNEKDEQVRASLNGAEIWMKNRKRYLEQEK